MYNNGVTIRYSRLNNMNIFIIDILYIILQKNIVNAIMLSFIVQCS